MCSSREQQYTALRAVRQTFSRVIPYLAAANNASIQVSRAAAGSWSFSAAPLPPPDVTASKPVNKPNTAGQRALTRSPLAPGAPMRACAKQTRMKRSSRNGSQENSRYASGFSLRGRGSELYWCYKTRRVSFLLRWRSRDSHQSKKTPPQNGTTYGCISPPLPPTVCSRADCSSHTANQRPNKTTQNAGTSMWKSITRIDTVFLR